MNLRPQAVAVVQEPTAESCVQDLVAATAALTPAAPAVRTDDAEITYAELNRRANQLAHHLRDLGVREGVLVACCLPRSVDLVVALLGILKAGGAYLPLDPAYPRQRLTAMLDDAAPAVLVTRTDMDLPISSPASALVRLDADAIVLDALSTRDPQTDVGADDLAYVIYTSGSTGTPKGVEITHGGLANLIDWHLDAFKVVAADVASQVTSPAFDATGWEIWPYLVAGATVHIAPENVRTSPPLMRDWLVSRHVTVTFLPTPVAESAVQLEWPANTSLRLLLTGADTMHAHPPPRLPFAVVNNYGPTETTVVATSGVVPAGTDLGGRPSIGRPISNTQVHILDEGLRPVPAGAVGEIYVGGLGVARGYRNRPELTSERFIEHGSGRIYRTGDLARFRADGQIDFLGRGDEQVKIRGFRIELEEVAAHLNRHPAVQVSTVALRQSPAGDPQLVAYVVPAGGERPAADSLRAALAEQLPDYMIPTAFVVIDALPLTPNGKVDRARLPAPDAAAPASPPAATATPIEQRLLVIVESLLRRENVGIDDNFFLLGGNSLMGAQLVTRTAEVFGVDVPLRTLFARPTVRKLAAEIEGRAPAAAPA